MGLIPNRGTKIPHVAWCNQKKKKKTSFMLRSAPHDLAVTFTRIAAASCKKICAWLNILRFHQNHIYTDPLPTSLEQSLRAIWNAVSWAVVLILPQIKLNSQLFMVCFFFFQSTFFFFQSCNQMLYPWAIPAGCSQHILKARWGRGLIGFEISLCMILWLVDDEVTGWCHRVYSSSDTSRSGGYMLMIK